MQSMFGLLSSSQIYGLQQAHEHNNNNNSNASSNKTTQHNNNNNNAKHRRSSSCLADSSSKESKFFATLNSMQSIKSPTNFIEKFLRTELLNGYDTIKNYKNFQHSSSSNSAAGCTPHINAATTKQTTTNGHSTHPEGILTSFNCLQGSYRSNCDGEFYESVHVNAQKSPPAVATKATAETDMTIKYSKNLLANPPDEQAPATLQNYQKLPECEQELTLVPSSGASSGDFNSDNNNGGTPVSNLYKRLSFGGRSAKNSDALQAHELVSDYSSSTNSSSTTTTNKSATSSSTSSVNQKHHHNNTTTSTLSPQSHDLQRTSSASSSGDCSTTRERKKSLLGAMSQQRHASKQTSSHTPLANSHISNEAITTATAISHTAHLTPERAQRRKLIQLISHYDQQNKLLQRELAKEKRRRNEELACVAKSLLCFESKLKRDMKSVNQRLLEKDAEICRLVRQNRALRKHLAKAEAAQAESDVRDEGVVEDGEAELAELDGKRSADEQLLMEDCLVLEALQCINCRKQFYDIDLKEGWTQTTTKDGSRNNDDHTTEHGSSSDDTVSSSFYGARRSVRYTSKRTSGTFRDYMRSRSMNIDDPALDQNSEENTSTISRDDSQTSYEKMNIYSRTIERMHGVKCESERESEQSGQETTRSNSRLSSKGAMCSSNNSKNKAHDKSTPSQIEEDDGIFSPTQDDDFEEADLADGGRSIKIVLRRSTEFSEASPKQVYETSTDDWYASASDPEEIGGSRASTKLYGQGAVNPVLECVNQILLQQSMEESLHESAANSLEGSASSGSDIAPPQIQQLMPKSPNHLQVNAANLPRRSSLSGRRSSRSNSHSSDGQPSHNGTLTRKRVHFSTKNSMVHVPRNDDHDDDDDASGNEVISTLQQYHPMNYFPATAQQQQQQQSSNGSCATAMLTEVSEHARLETLNYESIYSNEYEPIGSEHNSSNLYVDMESTVKLANSSTASPLEAKMSKMPPALPPKPANLLKFKKSLQQLDEVPDEHLHQDNAAFADDDSNDTAAASEPDYCSISEVNVGITSVQIVVDVHKVPESEADPESQHSLEAPVSEFDVEMATVASDDTCTASQKTDEIEEIFADIPKLPNVAAIIAPKHPKYQQEQQSDYLIMSPKAEKMQQTRSATLLNTSSSAHKSTKDFLSTPTNSKQAKANVMPLKLARLLATPTQQQQPQQQQYKRKHMPNILAEINKRMSQPSSPTTPTKQTLTPTKPNKQSSSALLKTLEQSAANLPLQAEFDWYNLDAEYGKAPLQQPDLLKASEVLNTSNVLAEIHEDHESVGATADEYNLDEEFSLACEKPDALNNENESEVSAADMAADAQQVPIIIEPLRTASKLETTAALNAAICEAVNFPIFSESSPLVSAVTVSAQPHNVKAKKMKKNLANFEKFIEGSGLSTKPLPSKRKIYFAGPFV